MSKTYAKLSELFYLDWAFYQVTTFSLVDATSTVQTFCRIKDVIMPMPKSALLGLTSYTVQGYLLPCSKKPTDSNGWLQLGTKIWIEDEFGNTYNLVLFGILLYANLN